MDQDVEREQRAIIAVIEGETLAFFSRDFELWTSYWIHDPAMRRLGSLAGGHIDYHEGWDASAAIVTRIMKKFPTPNPEAARLMCRDNFNCRMTRDMAWVSFDQYGPDTGDAFDSIGLSHQVRILEKHDGHWKIAFVGHGETSLEYFAFPAIRIDRDASILWMNEAATRALSDHPALINSGSRLRARQRDDDKRLRAEISHVDALTPMDIRARGPARRENEGVRPVVLGADDGDVAHLCWITPRDGMLVVTFNDHRSERDRLAVAGPVYGLSGAQMRLAALIVDGNDLSRSAKQLGVSVNTVRTQLQRMFDKTGVRSQPALVRVLLSVNPPVG